jgi:hypothetical protein
MHLTFLNEFSGEILKSRRILYGCHEMFGRETVKQSPIVLNTYKIVQNN